MDIKLVLNDKEVILAYEELWDLVNILRDHKKNMDIFHELSKINSDEILFAIAKNRNLHSRTIKRLISEKQPSVIHSLLRLQNEKIISSMKKEDIERYIDSNDIRVLSALTENVDNLTEIYEVCEKDWLCEKLYQTGNLQIKFDLACSEETSALILRKLTNDQDDSIAEVAQDTLDEIEEEDWEENGFEDEYID